MKAGTIRHLLGILMAAMVIAPAMAQGPKAMDAAAIRTKLRGFRKLADFDKPSMARQLAAAIRALPAGQTKFQLADGLASYSTEGYLGRDTVQAVADTLIAALEETPQPDENGAPAYVYSQLAELARYEDIQISMKSVKYEKALADLDETNAMRAKVDFTLTDMTGKSWTLSALKGKVVMVNFWGTWCPPCRKEMPDLDAIYKRFKDQGLVILALSNEPDSKVKPYLAAHPYTYTFFLDPGSKVHSMYKIQSFPKTFIYDREGKMVAQTIDMRTERQFLDLLAKAGLQ